MENLKYNYILNLKKDWIKIRLSELSATELDMFFSMLWLSTKFENFTVVRGKLSEFKKATGRTKTQQSRIKGYINSMLKKVNNMKSPFFNDENFNLFENVDVNKPNTIEYSINPKYRELLLLDFDNNMLNKKNEIYLKLDILLMSFYQSKYSKLIYKMLIDFDYTGVFIIEEDDFFNTLGLEDDKCKYRVVNDFKKHTPFEFTCEKRTKQYSHDTTLIFKWDKFSFKNLSDDSLCKEGDYDKKICSI